MLEIGEPMNLKYSLDSDVDEDGIPRGWLGYLLTAAAVVAIAAGFSIILKMFIVLATR
jgi:hypothetical protein